MKQKLRRKPFWPNLKKQVTNLRKTAISLIKKNKQDGFYTFSGVQLPELANQKLDLYFRVDPINGDNNNRSSISLMVSKGYENFVSPDTDSATFLASEKFLNSFVGKTDAFQVNRQIEDQIKSITASEKNGRNSEINRMMPTKKSHSLSRI